MSEPTGTAVTVPADKATTPARAENPDRRREVERRKAAAMVATLSWANGISPEVAYAVVVWCERRDVDPITELDVLGNKPLPNARYWQRKTGEMIHAGLVDWYEETFIHHDPRLAELAKGNPDAAAELERRALQRIRYGAPEEATGTALVAVKLKRMERPVYGCQWAGGGTGRKIGSGGVIKKGSEADPIGEAFPVESALTRAWGKVGRIVAVNAPGVMPDPAALDRESEALAELVDIAQGTGAVLAKEAGMVGRRPVRSLTPGEYAGDPSPEPGDARD